MCNVSPGTIRRWKGEKLRNYYLSDKRNEYINGSELPYGYRKRLVLEMLIMSNKHSTKKVKNYLLTETELSSKERQKLLSTVEKQIEQNSIEQRNN